MRQLVWLLWSSHQQRCVAKPSVLHSYRLVERNSIRNSHHGLHTIPHKYGSHPRREPYSPLKPLAGPIKVYLPFYAHSIHMLVITSESSIDPYIHQISSVYPLKRRMQKAYNPSITINHHSSSIYPPYILYHPSLSSIIFHVSTDFLWFSIIKKTKTSRLLRLPTSLTPRIHVADLHREDHPHLGGYRIGRTSRKQQRWSK